MNLSKQILQSFCIKEIINAHFQELFLFIYLSHRLHFTNYRSKYILQNGSYPVYFVFGNDLIVVYPRYCSCASSNVFSERSSGRMHAWIASIEIVDIVVDHNITGMARQNPTLEPRTHAGNWKTKATCQVCK